MGDHEQLYMGLSHLCNPAKLNSNYIKLKVKVNIHYIIYSIFMHHKLHALLKANKYRFQIIIYYYNIIVVLFIVIAMATITGIRVFS